MDTQTVRSQDLSALAWVHGELRRSLETAHKALRRYLKEADAVRGSDVDAVDPAVLRTARTQLHQGVGALELVGLPAVADVLRASEAAVQRMVARPAMVDMAAVETIERTSFALLDFLSRQLAGKPVSPVMLFPQYRAAQVLAGADRVHPADLWKIDWQWRTLPSDPTAQPRNADDDARTDMETLVLALMRQPAGDAAQPAPSGALTRMSDLCADLGAGARFALPNLADVADVADVANVANVADVADVAGAAADVDLALASTATATATATAHDGVHAVAPPANHAATLWQLAAAVFEAQAGGLLASDVYAKRLASRLLSQLRMQVRGQEQLSDRLAQDLLFFCAQATQPTAARLAPRLAAVQRAWNLARQPPADYETPRLGRFDPALVALARKRVASAKDAWSAVAGNEMHRMAGLADQFTLVAESLQRLFPGGDALATSLQAAVAQTVSANSAPPAPLAMEVATAILYLDASLEDGDLDHPELATRLQHLAHRVDDVRIGAEPQPLDLWMEELYRRVSDHQTMGSVVQELRVSLSEIEKQIDQYFRDPSQRQLLIPVPAQLSALRGVLSVLGLEQASAAALHMRDEVDALAQTEVDPHRAVEAGTFDRLAHNLGALSFLIDMLSVQPALAKSLFRYNPETGSLSAVMGQTERVSAFVAFDDGGVQPSSAMNEGGSRGASAFDRDAGRPAPATVPGAASAKAGTPRAQASLLEQLQDLASVAADVGVSDADLARRMEPLSAQAFTADQPDLARLLASAQRTLAGDAATHADAAMRQDMRAQLVQAVAALAPPPAPELPVSAPVPPPAPAAAPGAAVTPGSTGLEDDAEMREVFIEEAGEVVADARAALSRLADAPDDATDMTTVRRAFHTLKGSARMVGLRDFGEAAWACEQLYNARLAQAQRVDHPVRALSAEALDYLADWAGAIEAGTPRGHAAADVARAADALRLDDVRLPIVLPVQGGGTDEAADQAGRLAQLQPPALELVGDEPDALRMDGRADSAVDAPVDAPAHPPAHAPGLAPVPLPIRAAAVAQPEHPAPLVSPGFELDIAEPETPASREQQPQPAEPLHIAVGELLHEPAVDAALQPLSPAPFAAGEALHLSLDGDDGDDGEDSDGGEGGDDGTDAPTLNLSDLQTLSARVPDLPSADDLDLAAQPTSAQALADAQATRPVATLDFDLDLSELDEPLPLPSPVVELPLDARIDGPFDGSFDGSFDGPFNTPSDTPFDAKPDASPPATPEPAPPLQQGEAIELDLADFADAFDMPPAEHERQAEPPARLEPPEWPESQDPSEASEPLTLAGQPDQHNQLEPLELPPPDAQDEADDGTGDRGADGGEGGRNDQIKVIGPLRISIPLFNIYLNEADELSRRLGTELAEWALESDHLPVPQTTAALAHALAGSSATVGYADLSALSRSVEHALARAHAAGRSRPGEPALFLDAADEIRRLLHQFAAGFLRAVPPELTQRLAEHERLPDLPDEVTAEAPGGPLNDAVATPAVAAGSDTTVAGDPAGQSATHIADHIDSELFPIFEEEADELLPQLQSRLRDWLDAPADGSAAAACMRTLHTLKGGARLSGAMRLGEMAHALETAIDALVSRGTVQWDDVEPLLARADAMSSAFDALRHRGKQPAPAPAPAPTTAPTTAPAVAALLAPSRTAEAVADPVAHAVDTAVAAPADATAPAPQLVEPQVLQAQPAAAPTEPAAELPAEPSEPPAAARDMESAAEPEIEPEPEPEPEAEAEAEPEPAPSSPPDPKAAAAPTSTPQTARAPVTIDWQRFAAAADAAPAASADDATPDRAAAANAVVRVRAGLLDRMVNQAGEVSITRARIDGNVKLLQGSLAELTDSLERMRRQLRDIELQAETQISTRIEAAKAASQTFDPLEMDRFTRFQELTRFMAESVNDVATLQRSLQRTLQGAEDELAAQARLTRELQDDLLRTRMVEFDSMVDRLHRTARQAARDSGKQVRLEIVGGAIEVDRGVLERMAGPFEHLLRNGVAHGIEAPAARTAAGKDAAGLITVTVSQSGNEVAVEFADDGAGLDLARIRERAVQRSLLQDSAQATDDDLAQLIFRPGFSTTDVVTELAGRGVGLDVVRAEVNAMGGRIQTSTLAGKGTRFKLLLPLTTAVTQVVMLRCGGLQVAVPSPLIEVVRRVPSADVEAAYMSGQLAVGGGKDGNSDSTQDSNQDSTKHIPFFWLAALLDTSNGQANHETARGDVSGRTQAVVVIRSAAQRVAVHVDEVVGNQEVVVKNVGPQLSHLPGLAGVTLLPSGAVALIYNPVALASSYGPAALARMRQGGAGVVDEAASSARGGTSGSTAGGATGSAEAPRAALVLVVDDSLTVRRITQRLLLREGYRVVTAKDGLDALERLAEERPAVLLSDIEMPRMDGFDLLRNVRADARLAGLPVVMITSRIAQKHRDYAAELGVDHYLGKPYAEEELLGLVARYAGADIAV